MAAVHTEAAAIFGGLLINEAEDKIQFVKTRPYQPYNSSEPITFKIPGNTSQYVSLRDSYLYVKCHLEETDQFGGALRIKKEPILAPSVPSPGKKRRSREANLGDNEYRLNGKRSRRDVEGDEEEEETSDSRMMDDAPATEVESEEDEEEEEEDGTCPPLYTNKEIAGFLDDAMYRYHQADTARRRAEKARKANREEEYLHLMTVAEGTQDAALNAMAKYLQAKHQHRKIVGLDGAIVPTDNILHSMWNGIDVFMNGEQVSTTNQKYMYKSYIETVLNNSASTKQYQLHLNGFYGDEGNKDEFFNLSFNHGMEKRFHKFMDGKYTHMMGFLMSDMMNIQAAIVNGVEIDIVLIPNLDNIRLQTFGEKRYGRMVIDQILMYVCKRTFSKEVILAHTSLLEKEEAVYPFKRTEIRAYNGNKGNTQVTIENPYESKIPTRFIMGMIDADAYTGNFRKNPLNFQHYDISRAGFYIDDESISKPPYVLNPAKGEFIEPLMELYHILGKAGEDQDIGITQENYINGMFLLPFDVTPTSAANMEYLSRKEGGNCRLELHFHKPLPRNIIILTYAIFPAELRIDGARNCRVVPV